MSNLREKYDLAGDYNLTLEHPQLDTDFLLRREAGRGSNFQILQHTPISYHGPLSSR